LQFGNFGLVLLDFFGCLSLLLNRQKLLFDLASSSASFRNLASSASYAALVVAAVASWFGLG
jgi:hypothetical protein